jgi:hypothetical protein
MARNLKNLAVLAALLGSGAMASREKTDLGVDSVTDEDRAAFKEAYPTKMKKGGFVSASRRADGIAKRGKTRGKFV